MDERKLILALAIIVINALGVVPSSAEESYGAPPNNIKDYLDRLVSSYPDTVGGYDNEFLILKNGTKFRISDGRTNKTFQELLESPDVDDMFYARYPMGTAPTQPAKDIDPGRVRLNRFSLPSMAIAIRMKSSRTCARSDGFQSTVVAALRLQRRMALPARLKAFHVSLMSCRVI